MTLVAIVILLIIAPFVIGIVALVRGSPRKQWAEFERLVRAAPVHMLSVLLITSSVVLGLGSLIGLGMVQHAYYPLTSAVYLAGMLYGALAFILCAPVLAWILRRQSTSLRVLIALLAILLPSLSLFCTVLAIGLNGMLDEAPAFEAKSLVLSTHLHHRKNSASFSVRVSGWHEGQGSVQIPISWQLYNNLNDEDHVVVTVGPGRFGWEWLRGIRRTN